MTLRKGAYAAIMIGYYTFVVFFSWRLGFKDLFTNAIVVSGVSYFSFLVIASRYSPLFMDLTDLLINVFIFSFINFLIIFTAFWIAFFSKEPFTFLKLFIAMIGVVVGDAVFTDFYLHRKRGYF